MGSQRQSLATSKTAIRILGRVICAGTALGSAVVVSEDFRRRLSIAIRTRHNAMLLRESPRYNPCGAEVVRQLQQRYIHDSAERRAVDPVDEKDGKPNIAKKDRHVELSQLESIHSKYDSILWRMTSQKVKRKPGMSAPSQLARSNGRQLQEPRANSQTTTHDIDLHAEILGSTDVWSVSGMKAISSSIPQEIFTTQSNSVQQLAHSERKSSGQQTDAHPNYPSRSLDTGEEKHSCTDDPAGKEVGEQNSSPGKRNGSMVTADSMIASQKMTKADLSQRLPAYESSKYRKHLRLRVPEKWSFLDDQS